MPNARDTATTPTTRTTPWRSSARGPVLVVALLTAAAPLVVPMSSGPLLVVSALAAAVLCGVAGARAGSADRWAWFLLGSAQLANGIGNVTIASDATWLDAPTWAASIAFNLASLLTALGLIAFVLPPAQQQRLLRTLVDLLIVAGSAFVVGWHWNLPALMGEQRDASALGLMGSTALVLNLIGLLVGLVLMRSRTRGEAAGVRLAWASLVVATVGDTLVVTTVPTELADLAPDAWVWSSIIMGVGATYALPDSEPVRWIGRDRSMDAATVSLSATVLLVLAGGPLDRVAEVVLCAVVLLLLARQVRVTTERARLALSLRASEEHFRTLVQDTRDVIMRVDDHGTISYASPACRRLFGLDADEILGTRLIDLVAHDRREEVATVMRRLRTPGTSERIETDVTTPDGELLHVEAIGTQVPDGFVVSIRDVTERVELQRRLHHAAHHDGLTRIPNRASFEAALADRIAEPGGATVMFVDLDGFKRINDSTGHAAGDAVLIEVVRRIASALHPGDLLARFGGDEFTVLLRPGLDPELARDLAEQVRDAVRGGYEVDGREVSLGATVGVAFGMQGSDPAALVHNADLAMYAAKSDTGSSVRIFEQQMHDEAARRVQLESHLRRALSGDGLRLVYQPVVDLTTGSIEGVEALLRWFDGERVVLDPGELVALAESLGLIGQLGELVLARAITQAAECARAGFPVRMAVNVSSRQFQDADLPSLVGSLLEEHGVDPGMLTLEVTETVLLEDTEAAIEVLATLRTLGVRLAIDDFGTGYSGLAYLHRLPVHELKIDRSFVSGLGRVPQLTSLVSTVVQMGQDLGLKLVAEGVENPLQMHHLKGLGVHSMQGYLASRPLSSTGLMACLRRGPYALRVAGGATYLPRATSAPPPREDEAVHA